MPITVPTAEEAQELHTFLQHRNDEEWARSLDDLDLSEEATERIRRVSNSNKLALAGTTAYLLDLLKRQEIAQAGRVWDYLTGCGEQWHDHPRWKPEWANAAQARATQHLNQLMGIGQE